LAQLTIDSAVWDIERGKQLLINYIKTVGLSDEEQIDYVESLKNDAAEMQNLVKEINYSVYESRVLERITRQLHFVHERLYIRFHDMFTQHFNPTTITESGRKEQEELKINSNYFIDYVGYELLHEQRAFSLRVERYIYQIIHDVYNQINETSKEADKAYFLSSVIDHEVISSDYDPSYIDINYSKFEQSLKTFKNTKSFIEKNMREIMKDMFYEILD